MPMKSMILWISKQLKKKERSWWTDSKNVPDFLYGPRQPQCHSTPDPAASSPSPAAGSARAHFAGDYWWWPREAGQWVFYSVRVQRHSLSSWQRCGASDHSEKEQTEDSRSQISGN